MKTAVRAWDRTAQNAEVAALVVRLLQEGEPVALPTETVYGLAADALNPEAVAKVFQVKERPRFDPLIVHLPQRDWLERMAIPKEEDRPLLERLLVRFWPGPLTIVLPKRAIVPDIVTAGLETVALRMSAHPVFSAVIGEFASPIAAPSANRFGHVSPTTAQHVLNELDGRIPLIIDAGPTMHGLESTVISIGSGRIEILRSGPVTKGELSNYAETSVMNHAAKITAPGQLATHYAPNTPLQLIERANSFSVPDRQRVGLLAWHNVETENKFAAVRRLSERQNLPEAATNLFRQLRELDALDLDLIVVEKVPDHGLGAAIMDRLRRAAAGRGD